MKKLIITEKPSVAQQFAHALAVTGKKNEYIENEEYIITWCVGHLVTMSYPAVYDPALKNWSLEILPFLPDKYKYEVIENVKSQFKVVKECLNRKDVDVIYNAGDSGRESEYIQRLVYRMAGYNRLAQQHEPDENLGVIVADCPLCGGEVVTTRFGIGCSNYKTKSCKFMLSKAVFDRMDDVQFKKLLSGEKTDVISGLISCRGNPYKAFFYLEDGKVEMGYPEDAGTCREETDLMCPRAKCKKAGVTLMRYGSKIYCSCGYTIYASIGKNNRDFTTLELERLLNGETIHVAGLKSPKGATYSADIKLKKTGNMM